MTPINYALELASQNMQALINHKAMIGSPRGGERGAEGHPQVVTYIYLVRCSYSEQLMYTIMDEL